MNCGPLFASTFHRCAPAMSTIALRIYAGPWRANGSCPNVLPATGPVSAGGDQGRDFETFLTYLRGQIRDVGLFLGLSGEDTVVFCCTLQSDDLQRKVRNDLATVCGTGTDVDAVVYFAEADVAVAARHNLIEDVRSAHGVKLELIDGQAISELLSGPDSFWIAVEFLDIPAQFAPRHAEDEPAWYQSDRTRWLNRTSPALTSGDLVDLTGCVRYATNSPTNRGDIEMWLERLRPLQDHPERGIRQRARYETAVARLRGQEDMRPADGLVRDFLNEAIWEPMPGQLYSASILHQYAEGAWLHGTTGLSLDELAEFGERLEARVIELEKAESVVERQAQLLETLGRLKLRLDLGGMLAAGTIPGATSSPPPLPDQEWKRLMEEGALRRRADLMYVDPLGALVAWQQLVALLPEAPLFPVEEFASTVSFWAPDLSSLDQWSDFIAALDEQVEAAGGHQAVGLRSLQRAEAFRLAGKPFAALAQLQSARSHLIVGGTRDQVVEALLDASRSYGELGLLYAAKHYALAAGAVDSQEEHGPGMASSRPEAAEDTANDDPREAQVVAADRERDQVDRLSLRHKVNDLGGLSSIRYFGGSLPDLWDLHDTAQVVFLEYVGGPAQLAL
jgi:hypothetical protein